MTSLKKKKPPKLFGIYLDNPGPFYTGGALHYLNKKGKVVNDSKIRTKRELKDLVMSKREFNKIYYKI